MKTIQPQELIQSPFELIGKDWLLLAASKDGTANAMTCSWGGLGVLWNKNVAFIFVRHSRHTFSFMEEAKTFSLSWFDDPDHQLLSYFGRVSGREVDKIAQKGLHMQTREQAPCFEEARLTLVCRTLYSQDLEEKRFIDQEIPDSCYRDRDYHRMYVGEILWAGQQDDR